MAITDLTGTAWALKDSLITYPTGGATSYRRDFIVNITTSESIPDAMGDYHDSFQQLSCGYDSGSEKNRVYLCVEINGLLTQIAEGEDTKTLPDIWINKKNISFTITGGTDATNTALISWLESNANSVTPAVPAVVISYDGDTIATIDASGTEVLETNGKMMADDITIEYTEPTLNLQSKTVSPAKTSQTITPDSGYDGLSSVWVNSMPLGLVKTPATTINTTPSISVSNSGLITATTSATQNVTPTILLTGYVDSGEAGTITVSGSNTSQLTTQAATTYTPTTTNQTITSGKYLTGVQTILGDANLVPANIASGVTIFNVTGTYEGSGGGDSDGLITRTISQYSGSASIIGLYAFYSCSNLTTVSCLNCTSISNSAFFGCSNLTTVSFPNCTTVGSSAFANCTNLTTISFPSCTGIRAYAFSYCNHLTSAVFPNCTVISHYAFYSCRNLATISFPKCSYLGSNAFSGCYSLTAALFPECSSIWNNAFYSCSHLLTISFPKCLSVGSNAFYGCTSLTEAIFPKSRNIGNSAFYNCISLATASFPSCSSIGPSAFTRCIHLLSLYLLTSSVPTLSAVAVFSSTPISNYTAQTGGVHGSIFVKESLLASFKAATNWSVYSARMVGLTDAQIAALG